MKQLKFIEDVAGSGKTQEIIDQSDNNTLIVTATITLSNDISRRGGNNLKAFIKHYHQLIWDVGKEIGMPLSFGNWNQYEDEFIFEKNKELIKKYSKIFVDIRECKSSWIKILQRYFLDNHGEIYILKESIEGESIRLNDSVIKLINNISECKIRSNKNISGDNTFYITTNRLDLCERINQTLKSIGPAKQKTTTILSSTLDVLQEVEAGLSYKNRIVSFVTLEEEQTYDKKSLDYHWRKKEIHEEFDSSKKQIKLSTIESFNGLESDTIFIILTENSSIERDLYLAASRAYKEVYIFNTNINLSDKLRLNVDKIYNIHQEDLTTKIYIGLQNNVKKDILKRYFPNKYNEFKESTQDNYILDEKLDFSIKFLQYIFPKNQKIQIFNYEKKSNTHKVALTHADTNILLIAEQSLNQTKNKVNSFNCKKIIVNKIRYLLPDSDCVEVSSSLVFSSDWSSDLSKVNLKNQILGIDELLIRVEEKPLITPVEETIEYKKWKTYLEISKKSKIYKINKIKYDKKEAIFDKPKKSKFSDTDVLAYIYPVDNEYRTKDFGTINEIDNELIYLKLNENARKENIVELGLKSELTQIIKYKNALENIKNHPLRFYIFGEQKLPQLSKEKLNIKFKNEKLNKKQKEAIEKAIVSEKIFMIQGPPGTGKTTVISELAYQEIKKGNKVLISSESNDAIENALEKILEDDSFYPILCQGENRKKQVISEKFPIETKLGLFYKNRILKQLRKNQDEYLKLDSYTKEKKKIEDNYQDRLKNDETGNNSRYQNKLDLKELNNRYKIDEYMSVFFDIQKDFFKELEKDVNCESDLKEIYRTKINIVGATLSQIDRASRELLDNKEFDIALVDEVSKATPIELNLAILNAKKIILVGDQKQLPPMLNRDILEEVYEENYRGQDSNKKQVRELYENETVFERLIKNNPHAYVQLTTQYRMHQDIQDAVNHFYEEKLDCGVSSSERQNKHQLFDSKNLVWIDTSLDNEREEGTSFKNEFEREQVKKILTALDNEYDINENKLTVGVITFYGAQKDFLNEISIGFKNLEIDYDTVDKFQGQERDFIIVSMVRSNNDGNIGFARSLNRINVAFSRAKQLLVILGSADTFTVYKKNDSADIIKAKKIYKNIFDISYKETITNDR